MSQNLGLQGTNRAGTRAASVYSGIIAGASLVAAPGAVNVGSDTLLFSGAGWLNSIIPHVAISGTAVQFYDAPAAVSGGPITASGHKVIGVLPGNTIGAGLAVAVGAPLPIVINAPFTSGLAVAVRSGCAGFTVTYTPDPGY